MVVKRAVPDRILDLSPVSPGHGFHLISPSYISFFRLGINLYGFISVYKISRFVLIDVKWFTCSQGLFDGSELVYGVNDSQVTVFERAQLSGFTPGDTAFDKLYTQLCLQLHEAFVFRTS